MGYTSLEIEESIDERQCPVCGMTTNETWRVIGVNLSPEEADEFDRIYRDGSSGIFCPRCRCVGWGR